MRYPNHCYAWESGLQIVAGELGLFGFKIGLEAVCQFAACRDSKLFSCLRFVWKHSLVVWSRIDSLLLAEAVLALGKVDIWTLQPWIDLFVSHFVAVTDLQDRPCSLDPFFADRSELTQHHHSHHCLTPESHLAKHKRVLNHLYFEVLKPLSTLMVLLCLVVKLYLPSRK